MIIRKVRKSDTFKLAIVADDEWKPKMSMMAPSFAKCDGKIERCYVAEVEGVLVGFIYGFVLPNGMLIPEMLYVRSEYRKMGIGTKLLEYLEKESGCMNSMIFYNKSLHDYYSKRGYRVGENLEVALKEFTLLPEETP